MKYQYLLLFILFTASCSSQNKPISSNTKNQATGEFEYFFSNDTLTQKAKIIFRTTNQILFSIATINKKRNIESVFSDTAFVQNIPGTDNVEAYEDELESDMYPAEEYIYNKQCYITIGIDIKTKARLFIVEAQECKILHNINCPFGSLGTLRKK